MIAPTTALAYAAAGLAVLATGAFAVAMWRRRSEPAARPLVAVAVVLFCGAVAHLVVIGPTPVERALTATVWADVVVPFWVVVVYVVVAVAAGFWFLFTLQYTGRGGRLLPGTAAAIGLFWLAIAAATVGGDLTPPPEAEAETTIAVLLGTGSYFMIVLMIVGVFLVVTTALQRNAVRFGEALALAGGASVLALGPAVASITTRPTSVSAVLVLASGLFAHAVWRYPIFEAQPVARIAGRDRLIEEVDDAVVVADLDGRIRDLNPAGERCFDVECDAVLGDPLDAVLPASVDPAEIGAAEEPITLRTERGDTLAVTADRITDARDRVFGHLLVCRDVTERQRRERRLGVLNQLLTGAVSDRMAAVADEAATIAAAEDGASGGDRDRTPRDGRSATGYRNRAVADDHHDRTADDRRAVADVAREIRTTTTELVDLVARAREIERALAAGGTGRADVGAVVDDVVDAAEGDEIRLAFAGDEDVPPAATDAAVLEAILETLLADALERARSTVEISVVDADRGPEVHVVDDRAAPDASSAAGEADPQETTGDADEPEPHGTPGDADGPDPPEANGDSVGSRSELVVEMARLAARHVDGDVSTRSAERGRRTVIELPGVDDRAANGVAAPSAERAGASAPDRGVAPDSNGGDRP